jgi:hypothetical protein
MAGLSTVFPDRLMSIGGKYPLIGIPEITERVTTFVSKWNAPPKLETTRFGAVSNVIGNNLAGATTQRHPNPALLIFAEHKRPDFIQLQHIIPVGLCQGVFQGGQLVRPTFDPVSDGSTRKSQQSFQPTPTDPFQNGALDLRTHPLSIPTLGLNRPVTSTVFTGILLSAFIIMSVLDQMLTPAARAVMRYNALYHEKVLRINLAVFPRVPFHASSVKISPLPDFVRRAWLYLSVEDADEYIDNLTAMIEQLKCYQHGED